ncbi:MAG: hypothetical protein RBT74_00865 [Tenuifilaceae bacterium]|jgi:hypothetical protein|nr:hypothetical protein [Tenuifilaceae bacterium]
MRNKLKLKKELIANLTQQEQNTIKSGFYPTGPSACSCIPYICAPKPEEPTPVTTDTGGCSQWTEATCQP